MELLNRYLQAVKFWLPKAQQDDIIAEVSEDLRSKAEEREAILGRSLTQDEWKLLLKERGHPLLVANRFLPQHSLIGPMLLPIYWFVLKIVLACGLIPGLAVGIGMMVLVPSHHPENSLLGTLWLTAINSIFFVTLAFAILERYHKNWLELWSPDWSPEELPPVRNTRRIPRFSSSVELCVDLILAVWMIEAYGARILLDSSGVRIALTPTGSALLAGVAALTFANACVAAVNLARPYWTSTRHGVRAGIHWLAAILCLVVFRAGQAVVDITGPGIPSDQAPGITHWVNSTMSIILLSSIAIASVYAIFETRKALKRKTANQMADALVTVL